LGLTPLHRQLLDAADEVRGAPPRRLAVGERQGGHAPHQLLEEDAQLEAGEVGAEAEVRADAEGDVVVGRAPDIEPMRLAKGGGIAVGGRVEEQQPLPGFDALAAD
jgi:hypothetical protein